MFRKLLQANEIELDDERYPVRYYEHRTLRGTRRFCAEVVLSPADHIIVDDDSMFSLESKVVRLVPAMIYSRTLAGRPTAA
ncbi:MAG TPA: hypothetical protein VHJ77_20680 [Vicinamibacterales bacterium]|jgi:hypothetical protein|nr:hypothetical protein [Vicinamibacterales bacterium]